MKFGVENKSTTVNRFVLHILQRNTTHLAVITYTFLKPVIFVWKNKWRSRKTNIKLGILKGREEKSQKML